MVSLPKMPSLFTPSNHLQSIPISDAEIYYLPTLDLGRSPNEILHHLIANTPWRQDHIIVWNKRYAQPRLVAWYGDPGSAYTYSGITLTPLPWTDLLLDIKRQVEKVSATTFNSVLLNYYRDHRDSMGFHSDDEPELGKNPVIASLSLGEERTFILKHRTNNLAKAFRLRLSSGSLLLMKGATQQNYKHGIPKEPHPRGPRVNLTFRRIAQSRTGII
jgi:alkylated DNA repair dioxygenase AlkB